jgi:hypothetical protein
VRCAVTGSRALTSQNVVLDFGRMFEWPRTRAMAVHEMKETGCQ